MTARLGTPDRRRMLRGFPQAGPRRSDVIAEILSAYRCRPSLCLSIEDGVRSFGVSPETCRLVLEDLVSAGQLRRTDRGQYVL
jgi:predicted transcriptional regulator of viral defense system